MTKCDNCRKFSSAISLEYMKKSLCKKCFSELFERRVRKSIRKNKLIEKKDKKVAIALSGGKDSSTLLKILHKFSKKAPQTKLIAISIDEGHNYRKKSLKISEKFCRDLGIKNYIYSFQEEFNITLPEIMRKVSKLKNPAPACSYCGTLRRNLLNKKALELRVDKIATGHNLDDEIQSALMNFIRGDFDRITRAGALVGIIREKKFAPRIKPLRESLENEILAYAEINKIPFFKGKLACPYSRDAFRKTIREILEKIEKKHPGSKFQLLHSLDKLIPILRRNTKEKEVGKIKKCKNCGALTSGEICKVCEIRKELKF